MIDHKYVFVCGLPRSGTSILGRNIARMQNCTGFRDTGVIEDEGRFLQDVYPTEDECGGPGRFGFDPRAHLTERSALLTAENAARLRSTWHAYWDNSQTIFVEKTPANLLMTRFLQVVFPNSYFVVIKRHPIPVGMAAQKWKANVTPLYNMFEHWLRCHALFEEDKKYLKHVFELRYEDYVENPDGYHEEIAAFIGTRVPEPPKTDTYRYVAQWPAPHGLRVPERTMEKATGAYSRKYFERWSRLLARSPFRAYYRYLAKKYERRFAEHRYSLIGNLEASDKADLERARIPEFIGKFYCLAADTVALAVRIGVRLISCLKKQLRTHLPEPIKASIRRVRHRLIRNSATVSSCQERQV
jgi:hypothetical protein